MYHIDLVKIIITNAQNGTKIIMIFYYLFLFMPLLFIIFFMRKLFLKNNYHLYKKNKLSAQIHEIKYTSLRNIYLRFEIELQGEKTLENHRKIPLAYEERGQPTRHLYVNLVWNAHVINALYINLVIPIILNSSRHLFPFSLSIFDAPLLWKKNVESFFMSGFQWGMTAMVVGEERVKNETTVWWLDQLSFGWFSVLFIRLKL